MTYYKDYGVLPLVLYPPSVNYSSTTQLLSIEIYFILSKIILKKYFQPSYPWRFFFFLNKTRKFLWQFWIHDLWYFTQLILLVMWSNISLSLYFLIEKKFWLILVMLCTYWYIHIRKEAAFLILCWSFLSDKQKNDFAWDSHQHWMAINRLLIPAHFIRIQTLFYHIMFDFPCICSSRIFILI